MKDERNFLSKKIASLKRYYMWYHASKRLDLILVSEFPKSGGTWYCQMLSHYLQLPYPRNKTPKFEHSVLHGHFLYDRRFNKIVCVVRDGRDALISYYHHMYFGGGFMQPHELAQYKANAPFRDFENIKGNLPAYIEYMFTKFLMGGKRLTWSNFIQSYLHKDNVVMVKYEKLLTDAENEMSKSIMQLTRSTDIDKARLTESIHRFSFETLSKREKGKENKSDFLRKGIAGDWKNYFTKEACDVFNYYAGKELILLGYEEDSNWVNRSSKLTV